MMQEHASFLLRFVHDEDSLESNHDDAPIGCHMDTTMCYIRQGDKYLMLYRNKKENDPNKGKWIGVGGKSLPGETPFECVTREVEEETGFVLLDCVYRGTVRFVSDMWENEDMHVFTATNFTFPSSTPLRDGLPLPECNEGTLSWIDQKDMFELPLWEGDVHFLRKLIADAGDISMTLVYEGDTLVRVEDAPAGEA